MSNYLDDAWTAYGAGGGNSSSPYTTGSSPTTDTGSSGWGAILGSILGGSGNGNSGGGNQSNSGSIFSSPTWSDVLKGAQLGYGIVQSKTPPKFANVPSSPDQQKLNDLYFKYMSDPATSNNRAIVSGYARDTLNSLHPTWTPPATSTGETGYNGTANRAFSNIPAFDWSTYLGGGNSTSGAHPTGTPTQPSSPSAAIGGTGSNGQPATGVFAPTGTAGDPFLGMENLPPGFSQSIDPHDLTSFVSQYGKGALELATGIFSMNPVLGAKGAIDLAKGIFNRQQNGNEPVGAQDTQGTLSNNPAGMPGSGSARPSLDPGFGPEQAANWNALQNMWLQYGGSPVYGGADDWLFDDSGPQHHKLT